MCPPDGWRNEGKKLVLPPSGKPLKRRRWRMKRAGFEEAARLARLKGRGNRNAATVQCRRRPLGGKARSTAKLSQKSCLGSFFEDKERRLRASFCALFIEST